MKFSLAKLFIQSGLKEVWKLGQDKPPKIIVNPNIDKSIAWGFFDATYLGKLGKCGASGVLFLNKDHKISFKVSLGEGTYNCIEMNSLWSLMTLVLEKGVLQFQILGNSKLVNDFIDGEINLRALTLSLMFDKMK
jgi:hypothetical protein